MSKRIVRNIFENVNDENIALTSEISTKLSYKDLKLFINKISKQLAGNGLSNKDRAAIVLPNGPYMASSFLAISSYMSAAPLNPSYKSEEYEFYLKDLNPKIVLVEKNYVKLILKRMDLQEYLIFMKKKVNILYLMKMMKH